MAAPGALGTSWLGKVWARGGDDIWVVADAQVIWRFDGTSWTRAAEAEVARPLNALTPAGPRGMLAVGQLGLVLRFDGARWDSPTNASRENLFDVWAADADHAIAVGSQGGIHTSSATGWTWEGSGVRSGLFGVWGNDRDDVYAVGEEGVILRFDGAAWTREASGTTKLLIDVWGSGPGDAWAVGQEGSLLRRVAGAWSPQAVGVDGYDLVAVTGTRGDDVWALGRSRARDPDMIESDPHGVLLHGDGTAWTRVTELRPAAHALFAVASGEVLVAGEDATLLRCRAIARAGAARAP